MADPSELEQSTLAPFLDAERACPAPPPEVGSRVFTRLAASVGLPPGAGDGAPPAPEPNLAPPATPIGLAGRLLARASGHGIMTFVVGAAVGAASYGTIVRVRRLPERPALPAVVAPAPAPVALPPPAPAPAAPEPAAVQPPTLGPSREPAPSMGEGHDRGLAAERKLVEMARTALARGQTDDALAALRRHARGFMHGQLAEERDGLLVQALVAKGEFAQARLRAARFHRQHPQSLFAPVVEESLRSIP